MIPAKSSFHETLHGVPVYDSYRWLEERDLPETEAWIQAQQRRCERYFQSNPQLEQATRLVRECLDAEIIDQPARVGDFYFYRKRAKGQEQGSLYRRGVGKDDETLILAPPRENPFQSIGLHAISDDGALLAFEKRTGGEDRIEMGILDIQRQVVIDDRIPLGYSRGFTFLPATKAFLYIQETSHNAGSHCVRRRLIGEKGADEIVFSVPKSDQSRLLLIANASLVGAYLIRDEGTERSAEFWVASKTHLRTWKRVFSGQYPIRRPFFCQERILAFVEVASRGQKIVELGFEGDGRRVIVPADEAAIRECIVLRDRLYISRWERIVTTIEVWGIDGQQHASLTIPRDGTVQLLPAYTQDSDSFFYSNESWNRPPAIYEYRTTIDISRPWHPSIPRDDHPPVEVHWENVPSSDGVSVPLTLIVPRVLLNEPPSVLMTTYGGFGVTMTPHFSVLHSILLRLGVILAIPHVRGGGELGQAWHDAGRRRNRQKSFDDFIAAAEWLSDTNGPRKIATFGGSNAGLLVAATMMQRPDLFAAMICIVPLLDMLRYESLSSTQKLQQEYGTIADVDDFRALYAYSPYQHIAETINYPPILFVTGDQDNRCNPAHVRKMAAALQERDCQVSPILVDYDAMRGHAPALPLTVRIDALARRVAFLCHELEISISQEGFDAVSYS